jgi:cell wall-associated NlpC family hydrolase
MLSPIQNPGRFASQLQQTIRARVQKSLAQRLPQMSRGPQGPRSFQQRYNQDSFQQQAPQRKGPALTVPQGGPSNKAPQGVAPQGVRGPQGSTSPGVQESLGVARSLIGRAYGDPGGASGQPVGRNSPFMHCAQFVNAVYPKLPPRAPELLSMSKTGVEPKPGDVVCSGSPAPWGHVGIMTEKGTIIHSIPGRGVHESSRAEFERYSPIQGVISP